MLGNVLGLLKKNCLEEGSRGMYNICVLVLGMADFNRHVD